MRDGSVEVRDLVLRSIEIGRRVKVSSSREVAVDAAMACRFARQLMIIMS